MAANHEAFTSGGKLLPLDVFMPAAAGRAPFVLVLHGSFGMDPPYGDDIVSFAEALAENGVGAAIPYYLKATGDAPGLGVVALLASDTITAKHLTWRQASSDALTAMAGDARVDPARMGVLGFSLGGDLALSLGIGPPAAAPVRGVVDFFGPTHLLDPHWSRLPPTLIFHGKEDRLVDIGNSKRLDAGLKAAGRAKGTDFFYEVDGEGHGFKDPALTQSRDRTLEFFNAILQGH
ncbi:MAG TPA: dienelactone hydrolase family protein [Allosphingosinicella sp.]|jgi:dienelactone hydrolase|nr:dienelactone hydrolase family protein [Allosphingosinicella sp.]